MLLLVVPQFESLIYANQAAFPTMTRAVMGASHALKSYGLYGLLVLVLVILALSQWLKQPSVKQAWHCNMLGLPQIGPLIKNGQTDIDLIRFDWTTIGARGETRNNFFGGVVIG